MNQVPGKEQTPLVRVQQFDCLDSSRYTIPPLGSSRNDREERLECPPETTTSQSQTSDTHNLKTDSLNAMVAIASTLMKAESSFLSNEPPLPKDTGGSWEMITSFHTLRDFYGRSFAGTETVSGEPMMEWIAEHFDDLPRNKWQEATRFFMSYPVAEALRKGAVAFGKKLPPKGNDSGDYASVVIVREYSAPNEDRWVVKAGDSIHDTLMTGMLVTSIGLPAIVTEKKWSNASNGATRTFDNMGKRYKANHSSIMSSERHWYINMVGSDPESSGKGHGSQLMQKVVSLADEARMSCFLETNDEKNRRFYEKFGFKCERTGELQNEWITAGESLTVFYMVRRAASKP